MRHLLLALCLVAGLAGTASADVKSGVKAFQRGDYATAMRELKPLAEQDNVDAQYYLGEMYLHGHGVGRNFVTAAGWYTKAAEAGHARAQASLGGLYAVGLGVYQDMGTAYFWMITAAIWDQGKIRKQALKSLGDVAKQLDNKEKKAVAGQAARQWRK